MLVCHSTLKSMFHDSFGFLKSERSDGCIDFTIKYVVFYIKTRLIVAKMLENLKFEIFLNGQNY